MWIRFDRGDHRVFRDEEGAAMTRLLRGLVGRLRDESITACRGMLAASYGEELLTNVVGFLREERVPTTDAERAAISWFFGKNGPKAVADLLALRTELPTYRFAGDGPMSPEAQQAREWFLTTMARNPASARRLFAAYRGPASPDALPTKAWVYLLEVDPGADVAFLHSQYRVGDARRGLVEVFAADEQLPPFHLDALGAARLLWPHRA